MKKSPIIVGGIIFLTLVIKDLKKPRMAPSAVREIAQQPGLTFTFWDMLFNKK
jgi:hypothetical protein